LTTGSLTFVRPIRPAGQRPGNNIMSCGYDNMMLRDGKPLMRPAHILRDDGKQMWTREAPWHGRSGGGLIDIDSGYLLGCCTGYVRYPQGPGIYSSTSAVHRFLARYSPTMRLIAQNAPRPQSQLDQSAPVGQQAQPYQWRPAPQWCPREFAPGTPFFPQSNPQSPIRMQPPICGPGG